MGSRSIVVRLTAQVSGYVAAMRTAAGATKSMATEAAASTKGAGSAIDAMAVKASASMGRHKAAWDTAAKGMAGGALILGGAAVAAGMQFANFDAAMSKVRANIDATPAQMQALTQSVRGAGTQFGFSATESAAAAEDLAKAGLSASDIMGGALTGALTLAAAGGVSTAEAAETAANAMSMFGLKAGDVGHIADVLANGANESTASISSLSQGLSQGGMMAAQMGLSLEDTTGALAMFDQAGLKGSDAGRVGLRTIATGDGQVDA